jgi:VanZ family protein
MAVLQAARRMLSGWVPFAATVLVSLVVLFAPQSATPSTLPPGVDNAIHLGLFTALAWTGRRAGRPVVGLAIGLVAYAAGSEVLQGALPIGRSPDPLDAVVDTVGIALGLVVVRWSQVPASPVSPVQARPRDPL